MVSYLDIWYCLDVKLFISNEITFKNVNIENYTNNSVHAKMLQNIT